MTPTASQDEINKAYRKKSRTLHPDKVKQSFVAAKTKPEPKSKSGKKSDGHASKPSQRIIKSAVKEASDRFATLGLIINILRGPERDRYDYFLSNGFPKWRGTGYYYARFRPGLGSTLLGLFVFGGGLAHYATLILSRRRQRDFVERYIKHARKAAWGDDTGISGIPGVNDAASLPASGMPAGTDDGLTPMNRRQKRQQDRDSKKGKEQKRTRSTTRNNGTGTPLDVDGAQGPQGARKRVQAENGKTLLVDSIGNVYLEEEDDDGHKSEYLLDPNEILQPTMQDTVLYRLPRWVFDTTLNRFTKKAPQTVNDAAEEDQDSSSTEEDAVDEKKQATSRGAARKRGKKTGQIRS